MKIRKKLLSVLLTAALVFSLLPGLTLPVAASYNGDYNIESGNVSIIAAGNYRIYGSGSGSSIANYITVASDLSEVNITLSDVSVNVSASSDYCAFFVGSGTTVNLTLTGTNTLASGTNCPGLNVSSGTTLTVAEGSTGSLTATGGDYGAGIGSGRHNSSETAPTVGTIIINGGTVTAIGGYMGAGIGGGGSGTLTLNDCGDSCGTVTINGGMVTAYGNYGAGIGGGGGAHSYNHAGDGGTVTISGGTVTAGGDNCVGIGGGTGKDNGLYETGAAGTCVITGGSVACSSMAPTPTNGTDNGNQTISLYTVTLSDVTAETAVTALTTDAGYTYGTKDMKTDSFGCLYLWLP